MPDNVHVVSIIPARGGSKGIPGKNIQQLGGKPLVAWSIEASRNCPLIDRTIVSTDDEKIAQVSREWGAEVPFLRPAELGADDATTESVLQHAVIWLEHQDNYQVDIVVFLQPTDIFRKQRWLSDVVQALLDDPELESCFIGFATYKNFWQVKSNEFAHLSWRGYGPRQTKSLVIREDTGLACASRSPLIRAGQRIGQKVKIITNDDFCTGIDIQYPIDLFLAEKVISEWGRKPND
jgi:CMP-N-acetylneuraminic acid synthetase